MSKTPRELARIAANAHSNLNTFAAIISLLEGGHLYDSGRRYREFDARHKIIAICKKETYQELLAYDKAMAALEAHP